MGEQYKSVSSSLRNLLHSPVNSSLLGPNILLNTMFSNTLSFTTTNTAECSHLCPSALYISFLLYLINVTIFDESSCKENVILFSLQHLSEILVIPRINERDMI